MKIDAFFKPQPKAASAAGAGAKAVPPKPSASKSGAGEAHGGKDTTPNNERDVAKVCDHAARPVQLLCTPRGVDHPTTTLPRQLQSCCVSPPQPTLQLLSACTPSLTTSTTL